MKKHLYFLFMAIFATLPLVLTSCGDDDDEPGNPGDIIGTWQMSYYDEEDGNVTQTFIFNENGTMVNSYRSDNDAYNYSVTANYEVSGDLSKGAVLEAWGRDVDGEDVEMSVRIQLIEGRLYMTDEEGDSFYLTRVS